MCLIDAVVLDVIAWKIYKHPETGIVSNVFTVKYLDSNGEGITDIMMDVGLVVKVGDILEH